MSVRRLLRGARWIAMATVVVAALAYIARYGVAPEAFRPAPITVAPAPGADNGQRTIRMGWTAWADAELVSLLAEQLLEQHLGVRVERVMADIGIQYQAVASGELDLMLMGWLPVTHADYYARVRERVVDLGWLYSGRLGWVVPDTVPRQALASIPDLARPDVARRLDYRIEGIDPGSGLMRASERALEAYGLDQYALVAASGAAMTGALDRAIRRDEWVLVTAWEPHWIFARYDLRFLEDPRGLLGGRERVHALARLQFAADFPAAVTAFFSRMHLSGPDLSALLLAARDSGAEAAVSEWIDQHPRRVRYWVSGVLRED